MSCSCACVFFLAHLVSKPVTYFEWPRAKLFSKINIVNAHFGAQAINSQLLGASHLYMTARDFTRFGQLYLRDGVSWNGGERIGPFYLLFYCRC